MNPGNALCVAVRSNGGQRVAKEARPGVAPLRRNVDLRYRACFGHRIAHFCFLVVACVCFGALSPPPQFDALNKHGIAILSCARAGGPRRHQCTRNFPLYMFINCYRVEVSPFGQYPKAVLPEGECE